MKLQDFSLKEFLEMTASKEVLPAGGCSVALIAAIGTALAEMVANLSIGRKRYVEVEERMKEIAQLMSKNREYFLNGIDKDADSYRLVIDAYNLPKNSEKEILIRKEKIQEAVKIATIVQMELAERVYKMLEVINEILQKGNINAVTDGKVGLLACKMSLKAAVMNVYINLEQIDDKKFVSEMKSKCQEMENNSY